VRPSCALSSLLVSHPSFSMADASTPASPEPAALLEQALRLVHQISPHGAAVTEGFLESWLALEGVASPPPAVAALLANLRPDASLPTMTLAGLRDLVTSCNVAATAPDFSAAADADVRPLVTPLTHSRVIIPAPLAPS
jgi:hypothetical protein